MSTHAGLKVVRVVGIGAAIAAVCALGQAGEARAQYGPRAQPITGARTGLRYQPSLPSPFSRAGAGGVTYGGGVSRYGGFYGRGFGVSRGGIGFGYPGIGYGRFGSRGFSTFSLNVGVGGLGYGIGYGGFGLGYPGYGYGLGYGVPSLYGRYPYGTVGFSTFTYGAAYPYGGIGYGAFPYGYGYGYGGGYFGY